METIHATRTVRLKFALTHTDNFLLLAFMWSFPSSHYKNICFGNSFRNNVWCCEMPVWFKTSFNLPDGVSEMLYGTVAWKWKSLIKLQRWNLNVHVSHRSYGSTTQQANQHEEEGCRKATTPHEARKNSGSAFGTRSFDTAWQSTTNVFTALFILVRTQQKTKPYKFP
jgi:hypothetical protein